MALVKLNNRGVRSATTFGSITGLGSMVFIKKLTASGSATLSFVDGTSDVVLDDTYKEYLFTYNNIHPQTDNQEFSFNMSVDSGSNYNVAKTTTYFYSYHGEDDADGTGLVYFADGDLAQGTGVQPLSFSLGADNDQSLSGYLHLFNPSSTTFAKHFIARCNRSHQADYTGDAFASGYFNTTSAIDDIQFKFSSGNIDAGDICLYGLTT